MDSPLDASAVRADFPILDQVFEGKPLVYLDNAASSQKPKAVIDAISTYYLRDHANVHRGVHELARRATEAYEDSRVRVAQWIGAESASELVWTRGTSEALNLVAFSLGQKLEAGDEIIISDMEHHSNIVPWQMVAERTGAVLRFLDLTDDGRLDLDQLADFLGIKTRVVSLNHVSNALGTINPVVEIANLVRARSDALFVLDGAQGAPHTRVDVQAIGCDFYAFSGHKMCGPTGIGALWGRKALFDQMSPYQGGGEMIAQVHRDHSTWAEVPHKFEAGTPDMAGAVGMAAAVDYLDRLGMEAIQEHEALLTRRALELLSDIEGIRIFGPENPENRAGVVSFVIKGASSQDVATILDSEGIAVRSGHHCAQLVVDRFDVSSTTRASFYLYNTLEEVEILAEGLKTAQTMLCG